MKTTLRVTKIVRNEFAYAEPRVTLIELSTVPTEEAPVPVLRATLHGWQSDECPPLGTTLVCEMLPEVPAVPAP
jgi:hypothetical protein